MGTDVLASLARLFPAVASERSSDTLLVFLGVAWRAQAAVCECIVGLVVRLFPAVASDFMKQF